MSKPIIEVESLCKCYRIGAMREPYLSLRDELVKKTRRISSAFSRIISKGHIQASSKETDFWALNDVSFSVQEGEAIGIIGRNGAGKSTLLKILSQITPPTKGQITMRGRVASLLEVGTGFHPELTGRENIFLNGAIMGMRREEIKRKFDEIVAFAEVEMFLDTPVKRYSSGMYVRLAFAVAAHLEPEILIVDEVLAVGDAQFQKKCLGKMEEVGKEGRTVLFVSHNMGAIKSLCSRGMLLNEGHLIFNDSAETVINKYLTDTILHRKQSISGTKQIKLMEFIILKNNQIVNSFNALEDIDFILAYDASEEINEVTLAICFNNFNNTRITSLWTSYINQSFSLKKGLNYFNFKVRRIKLIPGTYEIVMYAERKGVTLERIDKFSEIVVGAPRLYGNVQIPSAHQGLYLEEFSVENV